jgi:multidrug efflux pump subunit AcrA (membrane-fusion protein)
MTRSIVAALIAGAVLVGCGDSKPAETQSAPAQGQSKQAQAQTQVCSARANIKKQLDTLSGMTASTFTLDAVKSSLRSITSSVKQITTAQRDLSGDRKQAVQQASSDFKGTIESVGSSLLKSLSATDAEQQLKAAAAQLQTGYKQALAPIDCGG